LSFPNARSYYENFSLFFSRRFLIYFIKNFQFTFFSFLLRYKVVTKSWHFFSLISNENIKIVFRSFYLNNLNDWRIMMMMMMMKKNFQLLHEKNERIFCRPSSYAVCYVVFFYILSLPFYFILFFTNSI